MRSYGKVSPRFWTGESGRALRGKPNVQLVALYLITAPGANMIGLFYLPLVIIVHETGLSETEVIGALGALSRMGVAHYDQHQEIVFVPEMARHQIGDALKANDKQRHGVARELQPFLRHPFAQDFLRRYWVAFCLSGLEGLQEPHEAPSKGVTKVEEAPSKPGSGSGTGTGGEPLRAPSSSDSESLRTGAGILSAFRSRWETTERKLFVKGRFDERDAANLADQLNAFPDGAQRDAAWSEVVPAIELYMRTSKPFYAGHPFSNFVKDLAALRTESKARPPPAGMNAAQRAAKQWKERETGPNGA